MTKTYFAKRIGADKKNIFNVSIMPCTTKLFESERDKNMSASGVKDYDMVITTRELAHLLREAGIDFAHLKDADADKFMSSYSGAGTIFGATGGVMEVALRTAYYTLTKKELGPIAYKDVRGLEGVKTSEVKIKKTTKVRIAVVHQLGNVDAVVQALREDIKAKREPLFIL